jgi:hypothetical protein
MGRLPSQQYVEDLLASFTNAERRTIAAGGGGATSGAGAGGGIPSTSSVLPGSKTFAGCGDGSGGSSVVFKDPSEVPHTALLVEPAAKWRGITSTSTSGGCGGGSAGTSGTGGVGDCDAGFVDPFAGGSFEDLLQQFKDEDQAKVTRKKKKGGGKGDGAGATAAGGRIGGAGNGGDGGGGGDGGDVVDEGVPSKSKKKKKRKKKKSTAAAAAAAAAAATAAELEGAAASSLAPSAGEPLAGVHCTDGDSVSGSRQKQVRARQLQMDQKEREKVLSLQDVADYEVFVQSMVKSMELESQQIQRKYRLTEAKLKHTKDTRRMQLLSDEIGGLKRREKRFNTDVTFINSEVDRFHNSPAFKSVINRLISFPARVVGGGRGRAWTASLCSA